jgi:hypothetical protein
VRFLCVLCVVYGLGFPARALDREAFTFTHYDLRARIEPDQQRLGVRGTVTLRNDSDSPQQSAVLQVSSSLHWVSIAVEHKPEEFVSQTYVSDIDHTGALSEAIVTLQHPVAPKQTVEIEIGYEGVIPQDATRLTRIGVPADTARHSDWDQIGKSFTTVRGIGYVTWYPVATESANLSEASTVSEAVGRWNRREQNAEMRVAFAHEGSATTGQNLYCSGTVIPAVSEASDGLSSSVACRFDMLGAAAPVFALGKYNEADGPDVHISYFAEHKSGADDYVFAIEQVLPWLTAWLGDHRPQGEQARVIDLPDAADSPFQSGSMLLMPLAGTDTDYLLAGVHQLAAIMFPSPHLWISAGLPLYAQARYIQDQKGLATALTYLQDHEAALFDSEKHNATAGTDGATKDSLLASDDEFYIGARAMAVWWMLHDMVGDSAFTAALHSYKPEQDVSNDYVQKLIEAQTHSDLSWFFSDWVYHDRGLPDFRIDSVFSSTVPGGGYMVTVTVQNLGDTAAEVPVTVHMVVGEATKRLLVPGKGKASIRIVSASTPREAVVNDGSVPETNTSNNVYKIESKN